MLTTIQGLVEDVMYFSQGWIIFNNTNNDKNNNRILELIK